MKKIFIIAGEHSGDMHGAQLAAAIKELAPDTLVRGLGGPLMGNAGVDLLIDTSVHTSMGLTEVLASIPQHIRMLGRTIREIKTWHPDVVVPIDYPDFNLRVAARLDGSGIPVVYYVSPQIWAWRSSRIKKIRKYVKKMLVIFPFEESYYKQRGVEAKFVGHPLLDRLAAHPPAADLREKLGVPGDAPLIGILPGSRSAVYARHWPYAWKAARIIAGERPDAHFAVALSGGVERSIAEESRKNAPCENFHFYEQNGSDVVASSTVLLAASGTSTVEAAILGTPMVVFYRMSPLSFVLARRMVSVSRIAMCNLIAEKNAVPELIQNDATPEAMAEKILNLLNEKTRGAQVRELAVVRERLGAPGASSRAAGEILETAASA